MRHRVLIADGDVERGKRIAEAFAARDIDASVATHGAAALEVALAEVPGVVVCQVSLPLIDGAQLGAILRANPRTERVGLVLVCDRAAEVQAARPEDSRLVEPPADPVEVVRVCETLLDEIARATPEVVPDGPDAGGVEGELAQLPLSDLLQLFHVSRKTGVVSLQRREGEREPEVGRVVLDGGDVVQAEIGEVEGEKALYRLLGWRRGSFSFRPDPSAAGIPEPIQTPTRALLREGQRQTRERERLAVALPPLDAHVSLQIDRARLPNVIHPLTQEVLLVLELYSRVGDVVDHCSFPDYQVLRTLRTLLDRGMLEMRQEPEPPRGVASGGLFSAAKGARLREWLDAVSARTSDPRDVKLSVVSPDTETTREFGRLLGGLPGIHLDPRVLEGALPVDTITSLGRLAVEEDVGIELIQVPVAERFAPLWPFAGHGAIAHVLLLRDPVPEAVAATRAVTQALFRLPRSRVFHVVMLSKGQGVAPDILRENVELLDEGALFLLPADNPEKSGILLREMFARVLP